MKKIYALLMLCISSPMFAMQQHPHFIQFQCKDGMIIQIPYNFREISPTINDMLTLRELAPQEAESTTIDLTAYDCKTVKIYIDLLREGDYFTDTNKLSNLTLEELINILELSRYFDIKIPYSWENYKKIPLIEFSPSKSREHLQLILSKLLDQITKKAIKVSLDQQKLLLSILEYNEKKLLETSNSPYYAIIDIKINYLKAKIKHQSNKITVPITESKTIEEKPIQQKPETSWSFSYLQEKFNALKNSIETYKKQLLFGLGALAIATVAAYKYWTQK